MPRRRSYARSASRGRRSYTRSSPRVRARSPGIRRAASRTSRGQTVRVVIEHAAPTLARHEAPFMVPAAEPRKAKL